MDLSSSQGTRSQKGAVSLATVASLAEQRGRWSCLAVAARVDSVGRQYSIRL